MKRDLIHNLTAMVLGAALASGVAITIAHESSAAPVPAPTPTPAPATPWLDLPACAAEDGPGPCLWDAQTAGNRIGQSFYIAADHCTYRFGPHGPYRATEFECTDVYEGGE